MKVPNSAFCGYDGNTNEQSSMCPGYTGSPLTCELSLRGNRKTQKGIPFFEEGRYLIGLQSLNFACNMDHVPSIYTKLRDLKEWIDYTIDNN